MATSRQEREGTWVVVELDEPGTKYYIEKSLLTDHSEYFRKALRGPCRKSEESLVRLDDVSCITFEVFVNWLDTMKLPENYFDWDRDPDHPCEDMTMIKAYALAHRLMPPKYLKAMEHKIIAQLENLPCVPTVVFAFENIPGTSPVLQFLVDTYCVHYDEEERFEGELMDLPPFPHEFLVRSMLRHCKMMRDPACRVLNACDYHDHASEAERENCEI